MIIFLYREEPKEDIDQEIGVDVVDQHNEAFRYLSLIYIYDFIHYIIMSSIGRSQKKVGGGSMTAKGHPSQSARTLRQSGI